MTQEPFPVRALFLSTRISGLAPPNDTAHLKVHYPADPSGDEMERNTGQVRAATAGAPFPVIIFFPGINVGPEGLSWLAVSLASRGMIVVTYTLIGEEFPGQVSLTPGIDIAALAPDSYGTRPSSLALAPILTRLTACHEAGPLAGLIDMNRIVLGGHSAGGTIALLNGRADWCPGIRATFAYAAHTAAATILGWPMGTMNPIPADVPVLIMGGSQDGIIAESAPRYGDPPGDPTGRIVATFEHALSRTQGDCVLAILKGANHFSITEHPDTSTARAFLDWPETGGDSRLLIKDVIVAFIAQALDDTEGDTLWSKVTDQADRFERLKRR